MSLFRNRICCCMTGADPAGSLLDISAAGVAIRNVQWEDALTVRFCCNRSNIRYIREICRKRGDSVRFIREQGIGKLALEFIHRPVLAVGCLLFLGLTLYLPTRVFFFRVEGNEKLPQRQILAAAEGCGIRFGISRKLVRSEKMKNSLLSTMPELKWAGINTSGCTGVISVRERMPETNQEVSTGVSSIAACQDGYITSCTVMKGNALCAPGQVVRAGQVLISGYTDCGICIRATQAQGEVFAQTRHNIVTKTPAQCVVRQWHRETQRRYSLIIGKKRINLWKGSGISDPTCGRMYAEYYITLPGGFRLPVCLGVETVMQWQTSAQHLSPEDLEQDMKEEGHNRILRDMVAGQIIREEQILLEEENSYMLVSRFLCEEMIGRVITEEIGETNGKTD